MITSYGLKRNNWANGINAQITMDDFFLVQLTATLCEGAAKEECFRKNANEVQEWGIGNFCGIVILSYNRIVIQAPPSPL